MKMYLKLITIIIISAFYFISCNNDNKTTTGGPPVESSSAGNDSLEQKENKDMDMSAHNDKLVKAMNEMMEKMKDINITGDFDIDFANMMIEHHKGAIEMSEEEVRSGKDEKIKMMAQNIITTQKAEVEELRNFVKKYKPSGMKHGEGELQKLNSEMESKMKAHSMTGDGDKDFANMMISHHEQAVNMSKKELANGMSAGLKKMAQKTITDQSKEIKEFNDWLAAKK